MSLRNPYRRRSPSLSWLLIGLVVIGSLVLGGLLERAWHRSGQIAGLDTLQVEIQALRDEVQATQTELTDLETRLAGLESSNPTGQLAAVQAGLAGLQTSVAALSSRVDTLALDDGGSQTSTAAPPVEFHLVIPRQAQSHSLSCESSASSMAAQYHGIPLSEADVLAALPRDDNPHLGFRGNVDGPTGSIEDYGVYAEPIMAVLNDHGLRATLVQGGLDGIKATIARGNPVIAWVTYNCVVSTPVTMNIAGQKVTLVPYQHVVVVTGYDGGGIWANDPYDGLEDYYTLADFERAMSYFGDMAVEVAAP